MLFDNINDQLEELVNNLKEKTIDFQENVVERVVWKTGNAKLIRERKDQFSKLSKEKQRAVSKKVVKLSMQINNCHIF